MLTLPAMMKSNTVWALVNGLAVGFLIGSTPNGDALGPGGTLAPWYASGSQRAVPPDWLTEKDLKADDKFAGLTPAAAASSRSRSINEKPCDCGCPHGIVAKCKGGSRLPARAQGARAGDRPREGGQELDEIVAATKKPDGGGGNAAKPAPRARPEGRARGLDADQGARRRQGHDRRFSDFQ